MGSHLCYHRNNEDYDCSRTLNLFGSKYNSNINRINSIYFQPVDIYQKKKIKKKRRGKKFEKI